MKLLYFGAKWCIPCTTLKPLIQSISKEEKIDVEYFDFDTDDIFEKYENVIAYDKYKELDAKEDILKSDILFLCLPTSHRNLQYNKNPH